MKLVVFDFDGTLVDSNAIKRAAFINYARTEGGDEWRMGDVLESVRGDRVAILEAYLRSRYGRTYNPDILSKEVRCFSDIINTSVINAAEMPGATSLLRQLRRRGYTLAVSSATPQCDLNFILSKRGWRDFFDSVSGSPNTKIETLRRLKAQYAISEDSILVIGDGEDDLESASAIGCLFLHVGICHDGKSGMKAANLVELYEKLKF